MNPLEVDVSAPAEVEINKVFKVTAKVTNKGEEKIENAKGEIFFSNEIVLSDELILLKKNSVQKIGAIRGKKSKKVSWMVRGTKIGNYVITVTAVGELEGNLINVENSVIVEVKKSLEKPRPRKWYQNLFDLFRRWFDKNE
ncbi:hypothetical protein KAT63_01585 [Candidatus Parcubacteria bacterium]|nr:hypothetical protein [Candidatus Parcubacteria bacterium]